MRIFYLDDYRSEPGSADEVDEEDYREVERFGSIHELGDDIFTAAHAAVKMSRSPSWYGLDPAGRRPIRAGDIIQITTNNVTSSFMFCSDRDGWEIPRCHLKLIEVKEFCK